MSTILVKENELKALAFNKLTQAGLDAQTAQQVADVLVHADITGVHSHGVIRVEHYCTRLNAGGLNQKQHSASNRFRLLSLFWTLMMEWDTAR